MELSVALSGLGSGLFASGQPLQAAAAYGMPVFEVVPDGGLWRVTCSDQHCGGRFAARAAALKFAREEAEMCEQALVCGKDGDGRVVDLIAVEHPQ